MDVISIYITHQFITRVMANSLQHSSVPISGVLKETKTGVLFASYWLSET